MREFFHVLISSMFVTLTLVGPKLKREPSFTRATFGLPFIWPIRRQPEPFTFVFDHGSQHDIRLLRRHPSCFDQDVLVPFRIEFSAFRLQSIAKQFRRRWSEGHQNTIPFGSSTGLEI